MRRIAVFGAAGQLGREVVSAAVNRGLEVHAVVPDPRRTTRAHESITTFTADLASGEGLEAAVEGCSVLVWAVAAPWVTAARGLVELTIGLAARGRHGVRVVVVSAPEERRSFSRTLARFLGAPPEPGRAPAEQVVRDCLLPAVLVRASKLDELAPRGPLQVVGTGGAAPGPISRAQLASFLLRMLDHDVWGREIVVGLATPPTGRPADPSQVDWRLPPAAFFRRANEWRAPGGPTSKVLDLRELIPAAAPEPPPAVPTPEPAGPPAPAEDPFALASDPESPAPKARKPR